MTTNALRRAVAHPAPRLWGLLALIALAELLTSAVSVRGGLALHGLLLTFLLVYSAAAPTEGERSLTLALALAPLTRMLSLSLPLHRLPQAAWYPAIAALLMTAFFMIARATGATRRSLGLCIGSLPLQLALGIAGMGLGAAEHLILGTARPEGASLVAAALLALSLLLCTGLVEELIFRGLLQSLAPLVLGRWGLVYVSLLFGALHIGYLSPADVAFATVAGLTFAQFVRWGGSILGATLAHGLTNITLFLVMPRIAEQAPADYPLAVAAMIVVGAMALLTVGGILRIRVMLDAGQGLGSRGLGAKAAAQCYRSAHLQSAICNPQSSIHKGRNPR